jgi:DNA polymerase II small subunit/DNA polymerase delta subunit B
VPLPLRDNQNKWKAISRAKQREDDDQQVKNAQNKVKSISRAKQREDHDQQVKNAPNKLKAISRAKQKNAQNKWKAKSMAKIDSVLETFVAIYHNNFQNCSACWGCVGAGLGKTLFLMVINVYFMEI